MGRVYKVYDTKTKEKIALKLLKPRSPPTRMPSNVSATS